MIPIDKHLKYPICLVIYIFELKYLDYLNKPEASCGAGAQGCDCKRDRLWVEFPLEEIKYLIFLFLRSGVEAKRSV